MPKINDINISSKNTKTTIMFKTPASYDSDEIAANVGNQSSELENGRNGSESNSTPENKQISGHHDQKQRFIYKLVFTFSLIWALVGLITIAYWMLKLRGGVGFTDAKRLNNLHPLLMYIFMVALNMYAVLIYRTHFDRSKPLLKWLHAGFMAISTGASFVGIYAIFEAHALNNIPNWYSLHSWIGTFTMTLFVLQFIAGFVAFLKPGLSMSTRAMLMPWHRLAGAMLLVLASAAALTGITETVLFQGISDYSSFKPITFIANFSGVSLIFSAAGVIYLLTESSFKRPNLSEEEPLKRGGL